MLVIIPILATILSVSVIFILGRPRYLAKIPTSDKSNTSSASLSIIIPARNESANIVPLLDSLRHQRPTLCEVIVVDDHSSDKTAQLSEASGATVHPSDELPQGWNGKPWACYQGSQIAQGDWLLFLDADIRLHHGAIETLNQLIAQGDSNTAYSIYPHHLVKKPYEQLSAYFNTLMVAGVNAFGLPTKFNNKSNLFGQTLLISKAVYFENGGHEGVKNKVLENFHFSKVLRANGVRCSCYLGKGLMTMRMFPEGFRELWRSWKKGFVGGALNVEKRTLIHSSLWLSAGMLTITSLCFLGNSHAPSHYSTYVIISYIANALACFWAFRIGGSFSILNSLFFPIPLMFYQTLFFKSLIDNRRGLKTSWKGRMVN